MANAQETSTGTSKVWQGQVFTTTNEFVVKLPGPAAKISAEGDVQINWTAAEAIAADPKANDPTTLAIARLMLSIRDGTWKPMSP